MQIYLPIAEISVHIYSILLLGIASGFMAGIFGIGGNFVVIPTLMFMGVPSPIALSSAVNHTIASSFSSFLTHLRNKNVDLAIGGWLLLGSFIGSLSGSLLFSLLYSLGIIDIVIALSYLLILGSIGVIVGIESALAIYRKHKNITIVKLKNTTSKFNIAQSLPFKRHFPHSNITVSVLAIVLIGTLIGLLVSIAGLGGGFILVPLLIYVLGLPTSFAIGTSVFQAVFTTTLVTTLHAISVHTVDIMLSFFLVLGAVVGAQVGVRINTKLPPEILRALLSMIILGVFFKLLLGRLITPDNLYSFEYQ